MAEKLNLMNELEQKVLDKEKELKAEEFYLQKQWEELEDQKKKGTPTKSPIQNPDREIMKRKPVNFEEENKQDSNKKPE